MRTLYFLTAQEVIIVHYIKVQHTYAGYVFVNNNVNIAH